jgi:K+-sensing histidine kinase KdpD
MLALAHTQSLRKVELLLNVVQDLSLAKNLDEIMQIVRSAARELVDADGATFILKDGDKCYYADEDAISPLWKGKRFNSSICISGWVMQNRQSAVIKDIYVDDRIPADAYRPTFVKSLAVVPIRKKDPIAAIGTYWSSHHEVSSEQLQLLQALADSTSIAMENIQLVQNLESKIKERTAELESFSYSVSHDLKAPVRSIAGFAKILEEDFSDQIPTEATEHLNRIKKSAHQMNRLIDGLLDLARLSRLDVQLVEVNVSRLVEEISLQLEAEDPDRKASFTIKPGVKVVGDQRLLRVAVDNLLRNAWKFSKKTPMAYIEFGSYFSENGNVVCFVKDNGAGFDMSHAAHLFKAFHRLHTEQQFDGTGIGLATVARVMARHKGKIWAQAKAGEGAQFFLEFPNSLFIN